MLGGVPQGGCASPLLWLLVINDLPQHAGVDISIYADDVIVLVVANTAAKAAKAAVAWAEESAVFLRAQGLEWDPGSLEGFWLGTTHEDYATRWHRIAPERVEKTDRYGVPYVQLEHPLATPGPLGTQDPRTVHKVPFEYVDDFKVVGVTLDPLLRFGAHVDQIVKKSKQRLAMARTQADAAAGAARAGALSPVVSIGRYALPAYGEFLCRQELTKLDVEVLHRLARIVGHDRETARIEMLMHVTGVPNADALMQEVLAGPVGREGRTGGELEGVQGGEPLISRYTPRDVELRAQQLPPPEPAATKGILRQAARDGFTETLQALATERDSRSAKNMLWLREARLDKPLAQLQRGADGMRKLLLERMVTDTLFRKYGDTQPCPACGAPADSMRHALTQCPNTAAIRKAAVASADAAGLSTKDGLEVLIDAIEGDLLMRFYANRTPFAAADAKGGGDTDGVAAT
jgi:hypothetical protein